MPKVRLVLDDPVRALADEGLENGGGPPFGLRVRWSAQSALY
jgi:hypothetical protein